MSTSFLVTGYCPCEKCCGKKADPKDIGKTKSGVYDKANHTLAAPSTYSFGTKIELEGYGTFVVEDRGGNIKNNRLDIIQSLTILKICLFSFPFSNVCL